MERPQLSLGHAARLEQVLVRPLSPMLNDPSAKLTFPSRPSRTSPSPCTLSSACSFTGGYLEVSASFPGSADTMGFWYAALLSPDPCSPNSLSLAADHLRSPSRRPGVWTLGNLGRAGYGGASESISALLEPQLTPPWLPSLSSTGSVDGVWPYSCVPSPCTCSSRLRL